jgi:hypothetical protein
LVFIKRRAKFAPDLKSYLLRTGITILLFFLVLAVLQKYDAVVGGYTYAGISFLAILMVVLRYFGMQQAKSENSWIRRTMILSMLRMFLAIIFFVIMLVNAKRGNANFNVEDYYVFAVSYCLFFVFALAFDIYDFRSNLRTLSKRPNENANR